MFKAGELVLDDNGVLMKKVRMHFNIYWMKGSLFNKIDSILFILSYLKNNNIFVLTLSVAVTHFHNFSVWQ